LRSRLIIDLPGHLNISCGFWYLLVAYPAQAKTFERDSSRKERTLTIEGCNCGIEGCNCGIAGHHFPIGCHSFRTFKLSTRMINLNQKNIVCNSHCNYKDEMNQEPMMDEQFPEFVYASKFADEDDVSDCDIPTDDSCHSLSSLISAITWDAGDLEDSYTFANSSIPRFLPYLSPTLEQESLHDEAPTMIRRCACGVDRFESGLSEMAARTLSSLRPLSKPVRRRSIVDERSPLRGSSSPHHVVESQRAIPSMLLQDSMTDQQFSLRSSMPSIRPSKDRVPDQIPSSMPLIMPSRQSSQGYVSEKSKSMPQLMRSDSSIKPPCQPQRRVSVFGIGSPPSAA
jgi:hypothetical protein